jgi:hypothetical protein
MGARTCAPESSGKTPSTGKRRQRTAETPMLVQADLLPDRGFALEQTSLRIVRDGGDLRGEATWRAIEELFGASLPDDEWRHAVRQAVFHSGLRPLRVCPTPSRASRSRSHREGCSSTSHCDAAAPGNREGARSVDTRARASGPLPGPLRSRSAPPIASFARRATMRHDRTRDGRDRRSHAASPRRRRPPARADGTDARTLAPPRSWAALGAADVARDSLPGRRP